MYEETINNLLMYHSALSNLERKFLEILKPILGKLEEGEASVSISAYQEEDNQEEYNIEEIPWKHEFVERFITLINLAALSSLKVSYETPGTITIS